MSVSTSINTFAFKGIDTIDVEVQSHMALGNPNFHVVGLPDKIVAESKVRVKAALSAINMTVPAKVISINLSPADLLKEGSHYDLPIALSLLTCLGVIEAGELDNFYIMGELALNGEIKAINGGLPAAVGAAAKNMGLILPKENLDEAVWSGNRNLLAANNLIELINHFRGNQIININSAVPKIKPNKALAKDFANVKGQVMAKRALAIAAAGGHNLIMSGPPGSGKSMLASCVPGILPKMSSSEILECTMIASIAGKIQGGALVAERPFRAPHHSCSMPAMVGGGVGKKIQPGEITLAHNGVL